MNDFDTLMRSSYDYDLHKYRGNPMWNILRGLYERNYVNADRGVQRIPKIIHQIWLGSPFPDKYLQWSNTWKSLNPGWDYRLWTDADVKEIDILDLSQYNAISNYGPKSDFLRYHILNQFGGVYVDTDFECLKPFDDLLYADFVTGIGYPMKTELYVGLIASVPHHPITERLIAEVNKRGVDIEVKDVLNMTSSYFFTRCFFDVVGKYMPGVVALPPDYFYPFPNTNRHSRKDAVNFIKPCSYAVHYWEVSWAADKGNIDWVRGEMFERIADFCYAPKIRYRDDYDHLQNTFNPIALKPLNFVYTHTFYVKQLFGILQHLKGKFVVITHNADENIDTTYTIPGNVVCWYAQNANVTDPRVMGLPIGIPNAHWDKGYKRRVAMVECLKRAHTYTNLVYIDHTTSTNPAKRKEPYAVLEGQAWVTARHGTPFETFIRNVHSHKFVVCPEGNGMDTHRMWEALYMGVIPIVVRAAWNRYFTDMPICFIDKWTDLTEKFLNAEYNRIKSQHWDLSKLNFEYWKNLILSTK